MEKNGMDAVTKGQHDSDEDALDLPLAKQESTKNGEEIKYEAKAVPVAPAVSNKEDDNDDGGKDGESPLQIPPELGLYVAKMMGSPGPGFAGRIIMQTRHYHHIFSVMRQSHANGVRFKCSFTFECSKHQLGQHSCLYGPKIAAVVLHMSTIYTKGMADSSSAGAKNSEDAHDSIVAASTAHGRQDAGVRSARRSLGCVLLFQHSLACHPKPPTAIVDSLQEAPVGHLLLIMHR
jgi:hypothetical protein